MQCIYKRKNVVICSYIRASPLSFGYIKWPLRPIGYIDTGDTRAQTNFTQSVLGSRRSMSTLKMP